MATRPDPDRFEDLYRSHRGSVYRFLLRDLRNREDAEDATQTAFLQAYSAYERGTRPERPHAWLLTIADNLRRRRFRARERRGGDDLPLEESLVEARTPETHVEELRDALETLPFNQRAALVLREVAGLSYDEIGRHLSLSVGAVQMLIFRARRTLREELATASRQLSALAPPWLLNLVPTADRLATTVRAGSAAGVATAAALAVTASQPAAPSATAERRAQPQKIVAATSATRDDDVRATPVRPRVARTRVAPPAAGVEPEAKPAPLAPTLATATTTAAGGAPPAAAPAPAAPAIPKLPVATPPLPVTPAPPALPQPALPLPELPIPAPEVVEGAPIPQLDAVLAGR